MPFIASHSKYPIHIFRTPKPYLQNMSAINSDDRTSKQYKYWSFFHSGSRSAPQQSIMTKCVPPEHLGKVRKSFSMYYFMIPFLPFQIFSIFGAISTLLGMAMSYLNTMVPFLARKNSLNRLSTNLQKVVLPSNLILQNPFLVVKCHRISFSPVVQFDTRELSWGLLLLGSWIWCDQYGSHCLCFVILAIFYHDGICPDTHYHLIGNNLAVYIIFNILII